MSDNMEPIAGFFRESGHRDRHFEVNEAGWDRLAMALDQKNKKRWGPFWWRFGGFLLIGLGLAFWLIPPLENDSLRETEPSIEAQTISSTSQEEKINKQARIWPTTLDEEPIAISQETAAKEKSASVASTTKTSAKSWPGEWNATTHARGMAVDKPKTANPPIARGREGSMENEAGVEEENTVVEVMQPEVISNTAFTSPESLPIAVAVQPHKVSLVSAHAHQPDPASTMQTLLGAPVYGAPVQGENINAWESERTGGPWQVAVGLGTIPASYQGVLFYYSTEQIPAVFTTEHTLADGSVIELYADGQNTARGKVAQNFNFYRFALYRDLGKGFGVKGGLLISTIIDKTPNSLLNQVPNRPDIAYFTNNNRSTIIIAELGLQYTFYRRQRFQPFLGLSVFNVMASSFRRERRFIWPGMDIEEVSTSSNSFSRTNFPGYYLEVGMQYLPAPNWSIGPSVIISGTPFVEPQLGFGIEARYRF